VAGGGAPGAVTLSWTVGGGGPYAIYRSGSGPPERSEQDLVGTTSALSWNDTPPAGSVFYYRVLPGPFWKREISTAAVDPASSTIIAGLAAGGGFGNGRLQIDFSINVLAADASVPFQSFTPTGDFYSPDCDLSPVPVPPGGALEGETGYHCAGDGDCHLLVLHQPTQKLYEMWRADISGGEFKGGCAAVWDLTKPVGPSGRIEVVQTSRTGHPTTAIEYPTWGEVDRLGGPEAGRAAGRDGEEEDDAEGDEGSCGHALVFGIERAAAS